MAGFDEAPIYYSNQGGPLLQQDNPANALPNRRVVQQKFEEFLRAFSSDQGSFQYSDALLKNKKQVKVDLADLRAFDSELAASLRLNPSYHLPLLENAAASLLSKLHNNNQDGEQKDFSGLQVLLYSQHTPQRGSLRDLTSEQVSQLVVVPGIVTAASNPKHKATHIMIQCKDCKTTKVVACKPGIGAAVIPRTCDATAQLGPGSTENCSLDPYLILADRSKFVDTQILKLQERPEDVPTGELPRNMQLIVDRHLVGQIAPGTRVTVYGIYSVYQNSNKSQDKAGVAIRMPYIRVVGLEEEFEGAHSTPVFSVNEEKRFKEFAAQANVREQIFQRMAPNIFGHDDIKKALACLLFGGARKTMPDGTHRKGDINVLLMGDPSTAKSQFLKFASKTAPIAVYTSGKGSSAAGLTATVVKSSSGEFYLEGGAMVLADNGVVCIDEFDKMRPEDRVAIHEAMEQQTISVAKAGITTMLKSRTSVLAAANPPSGRYDDLKTAQENIDLQSTILSRFDLIFIVKDERSMQRDQQIARHVLDVHRNAGLNADADEQEKEAERFLKRYLEYARSKCSPRLSEDAAAVLIREYVEFREDARQVSSGKKHGTPAVPITVRQLEAIVRISESLARMQLLTQATEEHVRFAIRLFTTSTMDAVRSGIVEAAVATDEQRAELHSVEVQIKRRVAIGSSVSQRKLVEELVRVGLNDSLVRRALIYMSQTKEVEFLKDRRLVRRLK